MAPGEAPRPPAGRFRRPAVMGVLNVTPDSFSDGGLFLTRDAAVARGIGMAAEGADVIDVGGESTRPGAEPLPVEEELRRVVPVIERLQAEVQVPLAVDTYKLPVAERAVAAGASMVNDVSALRRAPEMAGFCADRGLDVCLMHMRGTPSTMQDDPRYDDVVAEVRAFLEERLAFAVAEGVPEERVFLDPGIGFGKTAEHNLELLRRLDELVAIGPPVLVGASRKSFIGRLTGREDPAERVAGTLATTVMAFERGASVFRVHDVAPNRDALLVAAAVEAAGAVPAAGPR